MSCLRSSHLRLVNPTSRGLELRRVLCGTVHTVVASGELDLASAPKLGAAVARIPMDGSTVLVLDLREVTFIDCAGVRAVLVIDELCRRQGCRFLLVAGTGQVLRMFGLCGLLDRLPIAEEPGPSAPIIDHDGLRLIRRRVADPDRTDRRSVPPTARPGGRV